VRQRVASGPILGPPAARERFHVLHLAQLQSHPDSGASLTPGIQLEHVGAAGSAAPNEGRKLWGQAESHKGHREAGADSLLYPRKPGLGQAWTKAPAGPPLDATSWGHVTRRGRVLISTRLCRRWGGCHPALTGGDLKGSASTSFLTSLCSRTATHRCPALDRSLGWGHPHLQLVPVAGGCVWDHLSGDFPRGTQAPHATPEAHRER
jgi:hypothetical protein